MSYDDEIIEDSGLLNQDQNEHTAWDDEYTQQFVSEVEEVAIFEDGHCPHCGKTLDYGIYYDCDGEYSVDEYNLYCHPCRMVWGCSFAGSPEEDE